MAAVVIGLGAVTMGHVAWRLKRPTDGGTT
jgi:hypothetical protein